MIRQKSHTHTGHLWVLVFILSFPIQVTMQTPFHLSDLQLPSLSNGNNHVSCLLQGFSDD